MIRVARCETGGDFNPRSYNRSSGASGLFQFLPSTWQRTPFRMLDVFDAYSNALAAAWLVRQDGGWREWSCRP
jgi:soluble lytic murein transglycosylase-like protein